MCDTVSYFLSSTKQKYHNGLRLLTQSFGSKQRA